jgi:hypothetical protein
MVDQDGFSSWEKVAPPAHCICHFASHCRLLVELLGQYLPESLTLDGPLGWLGARWDHEAVGRAHKGGERRGRWVLRFVSACLLVLP